MRAPTSTEGQRPSDSEMTTTKPLVFPTMFFMRQGIVFVNGSRVRAKDLPTEIAHDLEEPPVDLVILEDITNEGTCTIAYPFKTHKCEDCWEVFISPGDLIKHIHEVHNDTTRFACQICNRSFAALRSVQVHYGICRKRPRRDPAEQPSLTEAEEQVVAAPEEFKCDHCPSSYKSKIGLGQHIRHRHPDVANQRRLQALSDDITRKREERLKTKVASGLEINTNIPRNRVAPSKIFTEEEDELIREWSTVDKWATGPELAKKLNNKTDVQVRSRRKTLKLLKATVFKNAQKDQTGGSTNRPVPKPAYQGVNVKQDALFREAVQTKGSERFVGTSGTLLAQAAAGEYDEEGMTQLLNLLKTENDVWRGNRSQKSTSKRKSKKKKGKNRWRSREVKRDEYANQQFLFEKNQKSLAKLLLDGKSDSEKCEISPEVVEETYKERFGGVSQEVDLSGYPMPEPVDKEQLVSPITLEEVQGAIRRSNKNTAAGPDQIDLKFVIKVNPEGQFLANLFNTWLCVGKVPVSVKENRSILLPKGSEGLDNINNWRPLTISSVLLRLYTSILAKRVLKGFKLNPRQRGFIDSSGCTENNYLLLKIMEDAKKHGKPLCVTFLDLAKAFDTVSHKHLVAGLERFQADNHFIGIVKDLYQGASTVFKTGGEITGHIPMTRGVKQGDPLSPLLFNIAMDPLLCKISEQKNGYRFGPETDDNIEALCYADDNALTTGDPAAMQHNCGLVNDFCQETGMRLNVKKSAAFYIKPATKGTYTVNTYEVPPTIGGEPIPLVGPEDCTKYLGTSINPWTTTRRRDLGAQCAKMLQGIDKSRLKPRQKLHMLRQYAMPRLMFPLTMQKYPKGTLKQLDGMIRKQVKSWLKLPECTPNPILYAKSAEGGIGLPQLERSVPALRINALRSVIFSNDPKIRRMAEVMETQQEIQEIGDEVGIKVPTKRKGKAKWNKLVEADWSKLTCSSKGREATRRSVCNSWLGKKYFSEADFITGLQLRAETFPCRTTLARGRGQMNVLCRRCGLVPETIGHISGACHHESVKKYRIRRHNLIASALSDKCKSKGWAVSHEPRLVVEGRVFIPDLIVTKNKQAVVLDPTIVYENGNALGKANEAKVRKYFPLVETIKEKYSVDDVIVRGFAIGARGGWVPKNTNTLHSMGICDPGFEQHLCRLALKGTINLVRLFMDV